MCNSGGWFAQCLSGTMSEGSKSSAHYLSDTNRFDVSSKGPSSGISMNHTNSRRKAFARNVESVCIA